MKFNNAKKQFAENAQLFGNASSQPEKYNLYHGLTNIAEGLEELRQEVDRLQHGLSDIRARLN